jgi:hypothetical protein
MTRTLLTLLLIAALGLGCGAILTADATIGASP